MPDLQQELPASARSLIQRKLGHLEEADRRVLTAASVQGYEFDALVVARVLGREPADDPPARRQRPPIGEQLQQQEQHQEEQRVEGGRGQP